MDVDQDAEDDQRRHRVRDEEYEPEANEAPQCREITGQSGEELTRGPLIVERDRKSLHVRVEVATSV